MSSFSRNKGKRGEREVLALIKAAYTEVLDKCPDIRRNTLQFDKGGSDIHGVDFFSIEVKRCETLNLKKWWKQAETQANIEGKLPALFYRQNGTPWAVICTTKVEGKLVQANYTLESWLFLFKLMLRKKYLGY